jgi:N-acetylmuramoyl-L-alanine amidase
MSTLKSLERKPTRPEPQNSAAVAEAARWRRVRRRRTVAGCVAVAVVVTITLATGGAPTPMVSALPAGAHAVDPALFTTGSCLWFNPLQGNRHETVFLDAGHGGLDPGAVGTTSAGNVVHEADVTLPVELDTMALLRDDGFRVVVSRTRDSTMIRPAGNERSGDVFSVEGEHRDVAARDVCANEAKAAVLVGIYFDAAATPAAGSVTAYDADRPFSAANLRLARLVQRDVLGEMNAQGWAIPDDGVLPDSSLGGPPLSRAAGAYGHLLLLGPAKAGYFSTPSQMPGALIEPLFVTDASEASDAASGTGQRVIAQGLAQAVEQYFGLADASTSTSPVPQ